MSTDDKVLTVANARAVCDLIDRAAVEAEVGDDYEAEELLRKALRVARGSSTLTEAIHTAIDTASGDAGCCNTCGAACAECGAGDLGDDIATASARATEALAAAERAAYVPLRR